MAESCRDMTACKSRELDIIDCVQAVPKQVSIPVHLAMHDVFCLSGSLGGETFVQFVMSPTAEGDNLYLYEQVVEPVLQSGAHHPYAAMS